MSKYYSIDPRKRAAAYGLKHVSVKALALFQISRGTAVRWASQLRQTGRVSIGKVAVTESRCWMVRKTDCGSGFPTRPMSQWRRQVVPEGGVKVYKSG